MKANKPFEKIYVHWSKHVKRLCASAAQEKGDVEYTRTDAFMKKAENFLEMLGYGFTITDNITHTNYDKEQLIADFRKYVEG